MPVSELTTGVGLELEQGLGLPRTYPEFRGRPGRRPGLERGPPPV